MAVSQECRTFAIDRHIHASECWRGVSVEYERNRLKIMKNLFILLSLSLCSAMGLKAAQPLAPEVPAVQTVAAVNDDIEFRNYSAKYDRQVSPNVSCAVEYNVVCPTSGNDVLQRNMKLWLCRHLDDEAGEGINDFEGLFNKAAIDDFNEKLEMASEDEADWETGYTSELEIGVEYEDATYVTLYSHWYCYMGGAHGSAAYDYATFRKSDGKQMDWQLLANMTKSQKITAIRNGLKKYFEVRTDNELMDNLDMDRSTYYNNFPLPETPPYLTAEGVMVIYQQYEIACYAAGMPSCVVRKM